MSLAPFRREFDFAQDPMAAQFALNLGNIATWTPTITAATPGDLAVVYSTRVGSYNKLGRLVKVWLNIITTTFTWTTATGALQITGLPFKCATFNFVGGQADTQGIVKAGFNLGIAVPSNGTTMQLIGDNTTTGGRAFVQINTDTTSGTNLVIRGSVEYYTP